MRYLRAVPEDLDFVATLLEMCREKLEGLLGMALLTQEIEATFQYRLSQYPFELIDTTMWYDNMKIVLPRPPIQGIDDVSVETNVEEFTSISTDAYDTVLQFPAEISLFGDAFGMVQYPWWFNINREPRVRVRYTCGYESPDNVPAKFKLMLLKYIAAMYLNREGGAIPADVAADVLSERVMIL